jgi:hypothetical protein
VSDTTHDPYLAITYNGVEVADLSAHGFVSANGSALGGHKSKTTSYDILSTDSLVAFSGTNVTVGALCLTGTLPPAADTAHQTFYVVKTDSNAAAVIVVQPTGSEGITGGNKVELGTQGGFAGFYSDGSQYHMIASGSRP